MKDERDNVVNIDSKSNGTPKYRKHGYYEDPIAKKKAEDIQYKKEAQEDWESTWGETKELNMTNKVVLVVISLLIIGASLYLI